MSTQLGLETAAPAVSHDDTIHVRDNCLCLHAQRAARALARRFDDAFRALDLTSGQFSILMSLNRPQPATLGAAARLLGMDRSTLTAALKPLARRALVAVEADPQDRRSRLLRLTPEGGAALAQALPIWKAEHAAIEAVIQADVLRAGMRSLEG